MLLEKQLEKELKLRLKESFKTINNFKSVDEILNWWYYRQLLTTKQYKQAQNKELTLKEVKNLLKAKLEKESAKTYLKEVNKIQNIKQQQQSNWGECSIDWVKNRTWGNCPKGEYRNGYMFQEFKSVTGCGYCKLSTLTAQMLNADINLKSYICNFVEKHHINKDNIGSKLGYGIRIYDGQPYFEGAVGVECHKRILERLGFEVKHFETKHSDIITFSRATK